MEMHSILAVDNEPYALVWLQAAFNKPELGFVCQQTAASAAEALEVIKNETPDLVVSDIRMPQMDGIAFLQQLHKEKFSGKVVLVSAFADFSYAQSAIRHGAIDYLLKPVADEDVVQVLNKVRTLIEEEKTSDPVLLEPLERAADIAQVMQQYIQTHYQKAIRIQELAQQVHLNPNYCGVLFQRLFGTTFNKYLTALRLDRAEELLKQTCLSISEIAELTGFTDVFYFSKVFKQQRGQSPSDFRRGLENEAK